MLEHKPALCAAIFAFLQEHSTVSEYQLLQHLTAKGFFVFPKTDSAALQLFKKHFVTRHCLYDLQQNLPAGVGLEIGPAQIHLYASVESGASNREAGFAQADLRNFYGDLSNLEMADDNSVHQLLNDFWRRLKAWNNGAEAFRVLDVDPGTSWLEVQRQYRAKIQQAHPDKGGNAEDFAQLRQAYEVLKKRFLH